jgi:hypothetical protein
MDDVQLWILKRRHEDLSQTFRTAWDLYIKFYTVFLSFSLAAIGWVVVYPEKVRTVDGAKTVIGSVFLGQTILTAITSGVLAEYSLRVAAKQERIERDLSPNSLLGTLPQTAVPTKLARWAGWANCAAMGFMAVLWVYVLKARLGP